MPITRVPALALATLLVLAGCAGASSDVSGDDDEALDDEDDGCAGACDADWPVSWAAEEDALLALVNAFRAQGGACPSGTMPSVPPLAGDERLRAAARLHAQDMGEQGYFDHTSLDGRSPWDRMADAGFTGVPTAENIAAGNARVEDTFTQWKNSDGHCKNMTLPDATVIGVGYAHVDGSPFGDYWVQNFGQP